MIDNTTYTVTMQVEVEAEGPARAVRQALDWAKDTQSRGGVITVKPGTLAALEASTRAGKVSELFTGPVTTNGPIRWQPKPAGVDLDKVRALASEWRRVVANLETFYNNGGEVANIAKAEAFRMKQCMNDLEALTNGQ